MKKMTGQTFEFTAKLDRDGSYYSVAVPASISKSIGKRGPVPVIATIAGKYELLLSLVPSGGGRHYISLNTKIRSVAKLEEGSRVKVAILVPDKPIEVSIPRDLKEYLITESVLEIFKKLPVGKQNHLIQWIEDSVKPQTRENRIARAMEYTHAERERLADKRPKGGRYDKKVK